MFRRENETTLLAKIHEERNKIERIESNITNLQEQYTTAVLNIQNLKPFAEYDISIAALKEERTRAIQKNQEADAQIEQLQARLRDAQSLQQKSTAKLNRLSLLVELQDQRLVELRNKSALAFFGIRGKIGRDAPMGSGGFLINEPVFSRRRMPNEVGVLDSRHAVGTLELDSRWPRNWAASLGKRVETMSQDIEVLRQKLETLQRTKEFASHFITWAGVVDQLRVIEAAHHELRIEVVRMDLENGVIEVQTKFSELVEELLFSYDSTLKMIDAKINDVYMQHYQFRQVAYS